MFGLDCDEAAEPPAEHKDRREPQNAADRVKEKPNPAHAFAAEGEKVDPIGIGRQPSVDDAEHAERRDHPAIGAVFPYAGADVALR